MAIRPALAALAIAALMLLALPPSPAAACPDDDCGDYGAPIAFYGPQGPDAFQDLSTGLYTFTDGSTSDIYDPPSWNQPTFMDYVDRAINAIENLFAPYVPNWGDSDIRG